MLTQILHRAQAFERRHGCRPNTLFLTHEQFLILRTEYPAILGDAPEIVLGLRIAMAPDKSLLQPEIAWLPACALGYLRRRHSKRGAVATTMDVTPDLPDVMTKNQGWS